MTTGQKKGRPGAAGRAGFTLAEMLVVVVIIIILMGVVFRMLRPAGEQSARAVTVERLERLKAAVEEFYAEYGQYPPVPYYKNTKLPGSNSRILGSIAPEDELVQPVRYECPSTGGMRSDMIGTLEDKQWEEAPIFTFGLMSFLVKRAGDGKWHASLYDHDQWRAENSINGNQPRDEAAVERWAPFLDGATYGDVAGRGGGGSYTNTYVSAYDGWERDFIYVSPPPHQSYLLFSRGPDGKYDYKSPGDRTIAVNKDNIYGDAGN